MRIKLPALILQMLAVIAVCPIAASDCRAAPEPKGSRNQITLQDYPVTIRFEKKNEKVARRVADLCSWCIPSLSAELGLDRIGTMTVLIVSDQEAFEKRRSVNLPDWGAAFAFMQDQLMVVDVEKALSTWNSLERTIPHEISHLLLYQRAGTVPMPLWFIEGLALWQAREWSLTDGWRLMLSVWSGDLPRLSDIQSTFPAGGGRVKTAYRMSYAAFTSIFKEDRMSDDLPVFMDMMIRNSDFNRALVEYSGEDVFQFSARFAKEMEKKYTSHVLIFQTGPLFSIISVLFLFVLLSVRLRNRRKLKMMESHERGYD